MGERKGQNFDPTTTKLIKGGKNTSVCTIPASSTTRHTRHLKSSPEAALPVGGAGRHHEAAQQGLGYLHLELAPLERRPLLLVAAAAVAGVPVLHFYLLRFALDLCVSFSSLLKLPVACAAGGEGESWLASGYLALGGEWCARQRAFL